MSWTLSNSTYRLPARIEGLKIYHHERPVQLESGEILSELTIGYNTYGSLNEEKDNVIWICHALTASSHIAQWWPELLGPNKLLDTNKYFIVCANILGSCYGTTGPRSRDTNYGIPYGMNFPQYTIRDVAKVNLLLYKYLKITNIKLLMGGSCGGFQCLEMAWQIPNSIERMVLLATTPKETPWAIATHEAARMAMLADDSLRENNNDSGANGLKTARAIGLLSHRTVEAFMLAQKDKEPNKIRNHKAARYIHTQGQRLERRFYPHCYYYLLNALDTHDIGRDRGGVEKALQKLKMPVVLIGIENDMLVPLSEVKNLAEQLPNGEFHSIESLYGHDAYLLETDHIDYIIRRALPDLFY